MNQSKTLEKCQKIMKLFEGSQPVSANISKQFSKEQSKTSKNLNKTSMKSLKKSLNSSTSSLKSRKYQASPCKAPFGSRQLPSSESRFQKIMKLQPKKMTTAKKKDNRSSYLKSSRSSIISASSREASNTKQSRLDKIMKLKVSKPSAQSTLKNYQPERKEKAVPANKQNTDYNSVLQLKRCKQLMRKQAKQEEKEDRLWKVFERERELRLKEKSRRQKSDYKREISIEKKFDGLVQKELQKIQNRKEIEERRQGGFSPYLFPSY